jgi:hypothetical protein
VTSKLASSTRLQPRKRWSKQVLPYLNRGVAYIAVLFLVAAISISMAVVTQDVDLRLKREKEQDWFFVGNQYKQAIAHYYHQSPDGLKALPKSIEDLLLDKRFIAPVRHLRKAYRDPLTNQPWQLVINGDGSLIGVRSLKQESIISVQLMQQLQTDQAEQQEEYKQPFNTGVDETPADMLSIDEPKEPLPVSQRVTQYHQVFYVFKPEQETPKDRSEEQAE